VICFDVLGTRKCQNFKFLTKSRFTTNRTRYTLLNFRKNPTGGVSIEMAEPIQSDQKESKSEQALQIIIGHVVAKSYANKRSKHGRRQFMVSNAT
jgi:hypothetical protein